MYNKFRAKFVNLADNHKLRRKVSPDCLKIGKQDVCFMTAIWHHPNYELFNLNYYICIQTKRNADVLAGESLSQ